MYFRGVTTSAIETLLDRVDAHEKRKRASPKSITESSVPNDVKDGDEQHKAKAEGEESDVEEIVDPPPTLIDFLEEEDLLPECRSDNERLLNYLSQEHILMELLELSIRHIPPLEQTGSKRGINEENTFDEGANMETTSREKAELPEFVREAGINSEQEAKRMYKWPFIAGEVLSSEIEKVTKAFVASKVLMNALFSFLETQTGQIDRFLCMQFSKIFSALLRVEHLQMLERITARPKYVFILINRVSYSPLAEILVKLLEGVETDEYSPHGSPPAAAGVSLLADNDVLLELANVFEKAAAGEWSYDLGPEAATMNAEEVEMLKDRYCEETMESIITTLTGITMRVLKMPLLKLEVPPKLNIYCRSEVIGKLLDSGSANAKKKLPSGALGFVLKFVTELMTTDANLTPEEPDVEQSTLNSFILGMSPPGRRNFLSGQLLPQGGPRRRGGPMGNLIREEEDADTSTPRAQLMNTRLLEEACYPRFSPLLALLLQGVTLEVENTAGKVNLLGSTRLRLIEFFVAFLKRGREKTLKQLTDMNVPKQLLSVCFKHEWSSMAHGIVASAIIAALKSGNNESLNSVWLGADLVAWVVQGWKKNVTEEAHNPEYCRAGYMGSVTAVAKELDIYLGKMDPTERERYVKSDIYASFKELVTTELTKVIEIEGRALGGEKPNSSKVVSDDEENYEEATEVFDMDEVLDGLSSGNQEAISRFADYLFQRGGANAEFEEEEDEIETLDVSEFAGEGEGAGAASKPMNNTEKKAGKKANAHPLAEEGSDEEDDDAYEQFVFVPSPKGGGGNSEDQDPLKMLAGSPMETGDPEEEDDDDMTEENKKKTSSRHLEPPSRGLGGRRPSDEDKGEEEGGDAEDSKADDDWVPFGDDGSANK
eukprot:CAMPEP_0184693668 /NCGR_PEP_ID=MMETSP0313-20130426/1838_1 /TAXON_ID=2792 /ORGANISM="Porphyridium aerugineum, Strain SAG 1380-2" /LENGTH=883 /DNA_ID=CAMNT_0027151805 /DNA_START=400 /DNA_END=3051 /DNA_ORIENTATION=+